MDDHNEGIWLTYEGILSEVESEYKAKFDATEKDKQWAVARRMFMAGKRSQQATAQRMYQDGREHAIHDLIDKAEADAKPFRAAGRKDMFPAFALEWLKSQLKGENEDEL